MIKQQLGDEYSVEVHKQLVRKALEEREYPNETIEEWLKLNLNLNLKFILFIK